MIQGSKPMTTDAPILSSVTDAPQSQPDMKSVQIDGCGRSKEQMLGLYSKRFVVRAGRSWLRGAERAESCGGPGSRDIMSAFADISVRERKQPTLDSLVAQAQVSSARIVDRVPPRGIRRPNPPLIALDDRDNRLWAAAVVVVTTPAQALRRVYFTFTTRFSFLPFINKRRATVPQVTRENKILDFCSCSYNNSNVLLSSACLPNSLVTTVDVSLPPKPSSCSVISSRTPLLRSARSRRFSLVFSRPKRLCVLGWFRKFIAALTDTHCRKPIRLPR
jgi:hypothetical protein